MFNVVKKEIEVAGKKISLETGKIARQADGAIIAQCGETVVLATAVAKTTVSPQVTIIAPSAWRATFPVSRVIFFPPKSISFLKTLNIYFLKFNLVNIFL